MGKSSLRFRSTKLNLIPHTWDDPKLFKILKTVFDKLSFLVNA